MIVDTSAWVEFLRGTRSNVCLFVRDNMSDSFRITGTIQMELLAGAKTDQQLVDLHRLLVLPDLLATYEEDFEDAARIYRICRRNGITIRNMSDCLIAATAIRCNQPILHNDRDFALLSQYTELQVVLPV
jgi:predicted nucleic acid-binding protein